MNVSQTGSIVAIIAALTGAYIAWRKYRPETNDITVTTADKVNAMTLRFAGDVSQDNDDLREMLAALRREFDQYRHDADAEMSQLRVEMRAERAEKDRVKRENDELRRRVAELESQVRELKARGRGDLDSR